MRYSQQKVAGEKALLHTVVKLHAMVSTQAFQSLKLGVTLHPG